MSKLLLDIRAGIPSKVDGWIKSVIIIRESTKATLQAVAKDWPVGAPLVLNFESWKIPEEIDKYIQAVDWVREVRPDLRVGYYSIIPENSYWAPYLKGKPLDDWNLQNALLELGPDSHRGLADVVDFVCPSLYPRYASKTGAWDMDKFWFAYYAPANIEAARQYQKQVYPFVWSRVATPPHDFTSQDLFRRQIQYCLDNADGVIIWDYIHLSNSKQVIADTEEVMKEFV